VDGGRRVLVVVGDLGGHCGVVARSSVWAVVD
jgi:hypothetical protein